jgi:hypothetical protein
MGGPKGPPISLPAGVGALQAGAASLCSAPIQTSDRKHIPAMRAETEKLVDEIKQAISLLRRHL